MLGHRLHGRQAYMMNKPMTDLCFLSARELAQLIRTRSASAREVMEAHLRQIEHVNPKVNAIVTLVAERALEQAAKADEVVTRGETLGPLHGLPVAHKDLFETAGIRTTYGSRIFQDHVPDRDAIIVERAKKAGAIAIGKTNTPEFGAGAQTFNEVFGATPNPYDVTKTCGGSSGGSAVALACGMTPLADGSDHASSLRNPAAFCGVVGLRPAPGRIPTAPASNPWSTLSVDGPMARNVADLAFYLKRDRRTRIRAQSDFRFPAIACRNSMSISWAAISRERGWRGSRISAARRFNVRF